MALLAPFAALRPDPSAAARVAAVPYDVVTTVEARFRASREPLSFLHVSRAEVDLPQGTNPYSDEVYATAVANLERLKQQAPMLQDDAPSLYAYRLDMNGHVQTGIAGGFSLDEYERHIIKRHERTRQDKEDDRTRHILALRAQTGPAFLVHRESSEIQAATSTITRRPPLYDFVADDGIRHTVWRAKHEEEGTLQRAFAAIDALYVADGHHRVASAARVRRQLAAGDLFLAVAFPRDQVQILAYNRVVHDLGPHDVSSFVALLKRDFAATEGTAVPQRKGDVSVFVGGRWYSIHLAARASARRGDRLDVSVLHDVILSPVLGIGDITRDKRIDFVGGGRGTQALERMVQEGQAAVAFSMYPVHIEDVMEVSDAGGIMPPKSTWFEPKLRDGLLSLLLSAGPASTYALRDPADRSRGPAC
jgi:uncharacterized protein (DUF1015 family)